MIIKPVTFYSEGCRLVGDVFYPADLPAGQKRAGVVLCHGYTGIKDLYLPDNARILTQAGYVAMTFDYKGWGDSAGPRSRLAPYSRVRCLVSVVGIGDGTRWMRSVRRPDEWHDLLERSRRDRVRRTLEGESELVNREEILLPDRQSAELATAARRNLPGAVSRIPLEYVDDTIECNPEWLVDKIDPRPVLFIKID